MIIPPFENQPVETLMEKHPRGVLVFPLLQIARRLFDFLLSGRMRIDRIHLRLDLSFMGIQPILLFVMYLFRLSFRSFLLSGYFDSNLLFFDDIFDDNQWRFAWR
ncbi:unnamed protein product [Cochlearia groenlandica]